MFRGDLATGREKTDLRFREIELRQILDEQIPPPESHRFANRTTAGQRINVSYRKIPLRQNLEHDLTHSARGAHNRNIEPLTHE
jgi:hypothetical protein